MTNNERDEIITELRALADRVKREGQESEIVTLDVRDVLKGQDAINYQVARMFAQCEDLSDPDLVRIIFRLGMRQVVPILKLTAEKNGFSV